MMKEQVNILQYYGLTGRVVLPCDPGYQQARQVYNTAIDKYPCIIVYCDEACDVANAILWARKNSMPLRIRSGGHHYEGYSIGNKVLVIDTSAMNGITVDTADDTVQVQAGVRLMDLYQTLYQSGYGFPGGTCPTVAISGLVLGGGIGLSTRHLGLTTDSLLEAQIVNACGQCLTASQHQNSNLFWALRGAGGGNYGAAVSYQFRVPKVDQITLIQLRWDDNRQARLQFLQVWQLWLRNLDPRMSAFGKVSQNGVRLNAFFYGTPAEAANILAPLLCIPAITLQHIAAVDFITAVKTVGAEYPAHESFQAFGRFVYHLFNQGQLQALVDLLDQAPSGNNSLISVYSLGGAVRDTAMKDTAFFYRQADYILGATSSWEEADQAALHREWVYNAMQLSLSMTTGSYVNFPYRCQPNFNCAYYGGFLKKLRKVKRQYDRCNVFSFPQGILK